MVNSFHPDIKSVHSIKAQTLGMQNLMTGYITYVNTRILFYKVFFYLCSFSQEQLTSHIVIIFERQMWAGITRRHTQT